MGSFAFVDATTWIAGLDATGYLRELSLNFEVAPLDNTVFGLGGFRRRIGGLRSVGATFNGFFEAGTGTPDPEFFTQLGVADRVITVAPDDAETTPAYIWQGGGFRYQWGSPIGEVLPFTLDASNTNGVGGQRGQVAKARGNVSSTGATGSVVQLGAVGASQYLYATLHVPTAGTTITVQVQSDDNSGFSSPTTRGTIGPITSTGGTWMTRVAGAITDTYYRFNVSAITGTFNIAGAIAIGS